MKTITPYSPELRALKSSAIIALDKPLLEGLKEVEGREFIFCESIQDLLMATSIDKDEVEIVLSTPLQAVFDRIDNEKELGL